MEIQNNTNCCATARGRKDLLPYPEAIKLLYETGYRCIDISFTAYKNPDFLLRTGDWERQIEALRLQADTLGVSFHQCHFPFAETHSPAFYEPGNAELFDLCMERACIAAGILGVKVGVQHPRTYPEYDSESAKCREENHAYYDRYVKLAADHHVRTAFENMMPTLKRGYERRYCDHYEQLIDLVDSYDDPMVGICWDSGHANQANLDQSRAIRAIGRHLIALHINDNHRGSGDEHLLPYMGDIDWEQFVSALLAVNYSGDLTYEVGKLSRDTPRGPFQNAFLRAIYENHVCFRSLYEKKSEDFLTRGDR